MADSIRQQIIDVINTQLQTIKKTTYETDLGSRIKWQKDTANNPIQESESEVLIVEVLDGEMEAIAFNSEMHELILTLRASAHWDLDIQDKMRSDIIKAMYNGGDHTWGSLADDTRHTGTGLFEEVHGEYKFLGVELEYTIQYQTANGDPYNLPS